MNSKLATAALPGLVEKAAARLFAAVGLPAPPISIAADGALAIGDPPKGSGLIEA